jgi:hypothetical protein
MIIREVIQILDDTIYRNYSDRGVYIRNKTTGILYLMLTLALITSMKKLIYQLKR